MASGARHNYGYGVQQPAKYCYEEAEAGCLGDYSESDGLSEQTYCAPQSQDVTEIYRRKGVVPPELYQPQTVYFPSEIPGYYYESVAPTNLPPPCRRPGIPPPPPQPHPPPPNAQYLRRRVPVNHDERITRYYNYTPEQLQEAYESVAFRSSPQIANVARSALPPRVPSATVLRQQHQQQQQQARRHPVSIRTPRYYRRPATVMKRPSALCLPVGCQRDPAVCRRARGNSRIRHHPDGPMAYHHPSEMRYEVAEAPKTAAESPRDSPTAGVLRTESGGDLNITQSDLDAMLARYERIIKEPTRDGEGDRAPERKSSTAPLRPRIPSSLRAKHERLQRLKAARTPSEASKQSENEPRKTSDRVEVEQITTEVLDNLLDELMRSGCQNKLNMTSNGQKSASEPPMSPKKEENVTESKIEENSAPKSVNYQEISEQIVELHRDQPSASSSRPKLQNNQEDVPELLVSRATTRPSRTSMDESSALQLHQSKSYIVQLIDRALSKELGTVPEQRFSRNKEDLRMDAKAAVEMMNRHADGKIDKELRAEITQALAESFVHNQSCKMNNNQKDSILDVCCSCNSCGGPGGEEPLYLRQLKILRWGHLKKIQKEVRRLEDIERFLDSCASHTNF